MRSVTGARMWAAPVIAEPRLCSDVLGGKYQRRDRLATIDPGALDPELAYSQLEGVENVSTLRLFQNALSTEPFESIMARSSTFCSSRMLPGSDIGITRPLSPMESFQSFYSYAWRSVVRSAVREREYRRGVASKGGRSRGKHVSERRLPRI
jgi:hypothetical protein